jgi:hypothetical protein
MVLEFSNRGLNSADSIRNLPEEALYDTEDLVTISKVAGWASKRTPEPHPLVAARSGSKSLLRVAEQSSELTPGYVDISI